MRAISCNKLNYLFYYYEDVTLESHIPKLSKCSINRFYYRLVAVIHNILYKYTFYEDD
jgi:hypothetical protein